MNKMKWLQTQEHFDWMQKCLNCWKVTEKFISHSIQEGKFLSSINACRDVTEMCSHCIKFEAQGSPFFKELCEVCADICESCASKLEDYNSKNDACLETIYACNTLAIACRTVPQKPAA
jgi:hypothetical protein